MAADDGFDALPLQVRTGKRARIEQHLFDVVCQTVTVPDAVVVYLVSPQEETLQLQRREGVTEPGEPLRHSVVIGIFGFEGELLIVPVNPACQAWLPTKTAIGANPLHRRAAVADKTHALIVVRGDRLGRAKRRLHKVVIEVWCTHRQLRLL